MTVTLADMKKNLYSFEDIIKRLEETEPMEQIIIDGSSTVKFRLENEWEENAKHSAMHEGVSAFVSVDGKEYQFTKEGILNATSVIGLGNSYVLKTPAYLIQNQLEYWYNSGLGDSQQKLVVVKGLASAFVKPTITSFSNIELALSIHEGIQEFYGEGTEVLGDFKFSNTLTRTDVRFIVPRGLRVMRDTNMIDTPPNSQDVWSSGINLTNSLTGKSQTSIESYLFRWWCTNGAIRTHGDVGTWNRKSNGQNEDSVYQWAAMAVDEVLGGMESQLDAVQALAYVKPNASAPDVLRGLFKDYKVPVGNRDEIQNTVLGAKEVTAYSIQNAITSAANDPQMLPKRQDLLMRVGGSLPDYYYDRTKAKIFAEGQQSGPGAHNPYEIEMRGI